jgi:hypothetical protein
MDRQPSGEAAERRVWGAVTPETQRALETGLAPTDLQTLLMAVARARARNVTAARLLQRWSRDRFVRPSACDPRRLARLEGRMWQLLPQRFAGVELSPVAPLGTCSALAPVGQHRVVSTIRGNEVLSDPTNALAVEAALRRREQGIEGRVDLAACHRVLRAQQLRPGNAAHFRLFALASSARDRGSGTTEAQMLIDHLSFWRQVLSEMLPTTATRVTVTTFRDPILAERLRYTVGPALVNAPASVPVVEDRPHPPTGGRLLHRRGPRAAGRHGRSSRRPRRRRPDHLDRAAARRRKGTLPCLLHRDRATDHARPPTQLVVASCSPDRVIRAELAHPTYGRCPAGSCLLIPHRNGPGRCRRKRRQCTATGPGALPAKTPSPPRLPVARCEGATEVIPGG